MVGWIQKLEFFLLLITYYPLPKLNNIEMKIGLWLLFAWLLYSCLGAFLNFVNMPWWVFLSYGFLAIGWSSESAKFILGIGFFGFWFRVISWLVATAAFLGLLVGVAYGVIAGNWMMGAFVGLGMGALAGLGVMVSAWLTFNIFFATKKRYKSHQVDSKKHQKTVDSSKLDNLNARILPETIWATCKGIGLAGIAVLGCYTGGVYGLGIVTLWGISLASVLFLAASELRKHLNGYKTFLVLFIILEIALISGYFISFLLPYESV